MDTKTLQYLECPKNEESNANVSMRGVLNPWGIATQFEASSPTNQTNYVGSSLARNMKVKPGRVCYFEYFYISCYYSTNRHHNSPTDGIQHPMNLKYAKK